MNLQSYLFKFKRGSSENPPTSSIKTNYQHTFYLEATSSPIIDFGEIIILISQALGSLLIA
jgi:hypothetical protein